MPSSRSSRGTAWIGTCVWTALACAAVVGAQFGMQSRASAREAAEREASAAIHERMLDAIDSGEAPYSKVATCFAPGSDPDLVETFEAAIARSLGPDRYQGSSRWSTTATDGFTGSTGNPITITYSFVPDGTSVPSGVGEPSGVSSLFSWLDAKYGSTAAWQSLFAQVFARWSELSGITYVYEPNDDGVPLFSSAGVLGVRGDVRISAKFIDGNSNVLAYNFFPNNGDMVLDANDSYFNSLSSNSRRLRNVVSHEHGHGQGQEHVCPVNSTKLMEPFVTTSYDGPRHDDIRGVQRRYGDSFEPDNSAAQATDLGTLNTGSSLTPSTVSSPSVTLGSRLSIDANGEEDYFLFTTDGPALLTITVTPVGTVYLNGPQNSNGSCSAGTNYDSLNVANLAVQLYDSDGTSILQSVTGGTTGQSKQIANYQVNGAQDLYVRVFETDSPTQSQLYSLNIAAAPVPAPGSFSLTSPTNGATGIDLGPVLDWSAATDTDSYLVEVADNIGFSSPVVNQVVNAPTTLLDLANGTLSGGTQYFWRVTAQGPGGNTASSPSVASFTTETPCVGDLNGDDHTDVFDFSIFASQFGASVTPNVPPDYDGDGTITVFDFAVWAADFACGATP